MPFDGMPPSGYPITWGTKPRKWAWRRDRLHPQALGLLRGCAFLLPLWEGAGGSTFDLIHGDKFDTFKGTGTEFQEWKGHRRGLMSHAAPVASYRNHFTRTGADRFNTSNGAGTGDFTLLGLAAPRAQASFRVIIGLTGGGGGTQCYLMPNGDNTSGVFRLWTYDGTLTTLDTTSTGGLINGNPHCWIGTRAGPLHTIYGDGQVLAGPSSLTARDVITGDGTDVMRVGGRHGEQLDAAFEDPIFMVAGWNRALTDAEARFLSRYPYALILPRPRYELVVDAAAAAPPAGGVLKTSLMLTGMGF